MKLLLLHHHLVVGGCCLPWLQSMGCAFAFRSLSSRAALRRRLIVSSTNRLDTVSSKMMMMSLAAAQQTADAWAEGKNAAPAIMCEVENIPLLDPIPDG
jgi:hypothetical protein